MVDHEYKLLRDAELHRQFLERTVKWILWIATAALSLIAGVAYFVFDNSVERAAERLLTRDGMEERFMDAATKAADAVIEEYRVNTLPDEIERQLRPFIAKQAEGMAELTPEQIAAFAQKGDPGPQGPRGLRGPPGRDAEYVPEVSMATYSAPELAMGHVPGKWHFCALAYIPIETRPAEYICSLTDDDDGGWTVYGEGCKVYCLRVEGAKIPLNIPIL